MAAAAGTEERGGSPQTIRAQLAVREMLMAGEIRPGERVSELAIVERSGASRTPVRAALMALADEGLLDPIPTGGYAARSFSVREVLDAIELRGTLEGLAARFAAERGASAARLADMRATLTQLDAVVDALQCNGDAFEDYVALNGRFHGQIAAAADSAVLERQIERAKSLPFASPNAFVAAQSAQKRNSLLFAQEHHRCVFDAISQRQGTRAESLMREHSRLAAQSFALSARSGEALAHVPGAALIRLTAI